jgi:hypothetical protein
VSTLADFASFAGILAPVPEFLPETRRNLTLQEE